MSFLILDYRRNSGGLWHQNWIEVLGVKLDEADVSRRYHYRTPAQFTLSEAQVKRETQVGDPIRVSD